jgi:carboxypeptidase family protein
VKGQRASGSASERVSGLPSAAQASARFAGFCPVDSSTPSASIAAEVYGRLAIPKSARGSFGSLALCARALRMTVVGRVRWFPALLQRARKNGAPGFLLGAAILLGMLAPMCAEAQSGANTALSGPYRIAGSVVNAMSGEPVHGAMVEILTVGDGRTFASTETDSEGQFALEQVPAGKFQLSASKRGFCTSLYDQHGEFNTAIVTGEGQETGKLVFRLTPAAVLRGVVTAEGGDAVENATVMLYKKPAGHDPEARIEAAGTQMTDDTGAYEFAGLEAGEYLLAVRARPWYAMNNPNNGPGVGRAQQAETEQQAALDVAYPVTYFDSTTDEASATPIELAGGSREEADISLHAVPALHLEMAAQKTPGGAGPGNLRQIVFGVPLNEADGFSPVGGPDGPAEAAGLAPGDYVFMQGDPPRAVEMNLSASGEIDPGAGAPTVEVKGLVEDGRGAPVSDALVFLDPAPGTTQLPVTQVSINRGAFSFPAVPPGMWRVQVQLRAQMNGGGQVSEMQVAAVTVAGKTQAGDRITVGDRPLNVIVTATAHAAHIEGFVRKDGKGVAGAMVVLAPKDLRAIAMLARRDQSDSDGSFNLLNVAPGEYTVVAITDGWNLDWGNPAVIGRYLPGGETVTVKDDAGIAPDGRSGATIRLPEGVVAQSP